ncbi:RDD family protein [Bacillaceae bacterium S4-13-56]
MKNQIYYAGFWIRFWAFLFDLVVIYSLIRMVISPVFLYFDFPIDDGIFSVYTIMTTTIFYGYFVFMTKWFGQTIGKMIFGLKVISTNNEKLTWSAVLFREGIGRFISITPFYIPFLVVGFHPKKKGLHDYFADTAVILERFSQFDDQKTSISVS